MMRRSKSGGSNQPTNRRKQQRQQATAADNVSITTITKMWSTLQQQTQLYLLYFIIKSNLIAYSITSVQL